MLIFKTCTYLFAILITASTTPTINAHNMRTKMETKIADKRSDITFNAGTAAVGAVLFWIGSRTHPQNATRNELLAYAMGSVFTAAGVYFGAQDIKELIRLKKKLETCNDQPH